jgi:hypothetical protein
VPHRVRIAVDSLNPEVVDQIQGVLEIHFAPSPVVLADDGVVYCYTHRRREPKHLRGEIKALLREYDLDDDVEIRIEKWMGPKRGYVARRSERRRAPMHLRPLTDVRWVVEVVPDGVFKWKHVRAECERRGRPIVEEDERSLEVPAVDEDDARRLAAALEEAGGVRQTSIRRLGWFERWRRREQIFGNYGSGSGAGF